MEHQYVYRVAASSTTLRSGIVTVDDVEPSLPFSAPPEFQGESGRWTPEHFFLAAVAGCFVSTFSGIATFSKFEFLSLSLEVEGLIAKDEEGWRFTQIYLRPTLEVSLEEHREKANRLLQKAEKTCLVTRSIKCPVALEPQILAQEELFERQKMPNSFPVT